MVDTMAPPTCDGPMSIKTIDSFRITPRRERIVFWCTDKDGRRAKIRETHLQRQRDRFVQDFWRAQARRQTNGDKVKRAGRQRVTGLDSFHMLRVVRHRVTKDNKHKLLIQWCGYSGQLGDASWEPYAKVWDTEYRIVEEYYRKKGLDLPMDMDPNMSDTSDDDEAEELEVRNERSPVVVDVEDDE